MGEVKWVKFEVGMYDDIKLKILDDMENRDLNQNVWARSLVLAGKINRGGYLYITDNMPHTIKTLSTEFNRSVEEIKSAYKILRKLEMIELTTDKVFKIKNWDKHQNVEGMEKSRQLNNARVARCRAKKKELNEENIEKNLNNESVKDDFNNSNVTEEINDNKTNNNCNVTGNGNNLDCNVTVMEQNKKENKNKKEIKRESNNTNDIDNKCKIYEKELGESTLFKTKSDRSKNNLLVIADKSNKFEYKNKAIETQSVNSKAIEILMHYEQLTGIPGIFNHGSIALAIDMHGEKFVKMAINKAIEVKKLDMTYINGILKNWRREGYPKDEVEVKKNGQGGFGRNSSENKNEFAGFKPKEPRKLTEAERRRAEEKLI